MINIDKGGKIPVEVMKILLGDNVINDYISVDANINIKNSVVPNNNGIVVEFVNPEFEGSFLNLSQSAIDNIKNAGININDPITFEPDVYINDIKI